MIMETTHETDEFCVIFQTLNRKRNSSSSSSYLLVGHESRSCGECSPKRTQTCTVVNIHQKKQTKKTKQNPELTQKCLLAETAHRDGSVTLSIWHSINTAARRQQAGSLTTERKTEAGELYAKVQMQPGGGG